jgi:hypothetical protein
MLPAYVADAKFWALLVRFDEDLAAQARARGCAHCAAPLHSARYPRKPRGISRSVLGDDYAYRLSFCCSRQGCRLRCTPASVRFFGARVYLGALVVLISTLSQGLTVKGRGQLCARLSVDEHTVRRWRRWWREGLPVTPWWQVARGDFAPPLAVRQLPGVLLERFMAQAPTAEQGLLAALGFLAPLSRRSAHGC